MRGHVVSYAEMQFLQGSFFLDVILHVVSLIILITKIITTIKTSHPKTMLDLPPGGLFTRTEVFYCVLETYWLP